MRLHDNLNIPVPQIYKLMKLYPPYRPSPGTPTKKYLDSHPDDYLVKALFDKYPDLKYVSSSNFSGFGSPRRDENFVLSFIYQQKRLMKNGYNQDKAFEMVEKKFQKRFSEKLEAAQMSTHLAMNNSARSLLSLAQQQAEKEAILKVRRLARDIPLYKEAQQHMNRTLRKMEEQSAKPTKARSGDEEEGDFEFKKETELSAEEEAALEKEFEEYDPEGSEFEAGEGVVSEEENRHKYIRTLYKVVPELKEDPDAPFDREKRTKIIREFTNNTKNIFHLYYERAAAADKLSGLTDKEIMDTVATSPNRIKKQSRELLKKLEKHNIKLSADGEVDFSGCTEPNIIRKLKDNPLVKMVLFQRDLEFEYPHREIQMEAAKKAKAEFEDSKQFRADEKKREEEEWRRERAGEIAASSEQSPFHQQFKIQYPQADPLIIAKEEKSAREKAAEASELNREGLSAEATYRVFETYEERLTRLEKKWLKNRLSTFEGGVEKPSENEKKELLDKAVDKMRRLKFMFEQKNVKEARDLLFQEHSVFTKDEILVDEEMPVEKLYDYLRQPDEVRRIHTADELDDNKILGLIQRREVLEDSVKPYADNAASRKTLADTFEVKLRRINRIKKTTFGEHSVHHMEETEAYEDQSKPARHDDTPAFMISDIAPDVSQMGEKKGEKKKFMDYIKETTMKMALAEGRTPPPEDKVKGRKTKKEKQAIKDAKAAAKRNR